jgi:hypothetical protein
MADQNEVRRIARARSLGIDVSQMAEESSIEEVARRVEELEAEIRQDLEASNRYLAQHGSFAEMARQHDGELCNG